MWGRATQRGLEESVVFTSWRSRCKGWGCDSVAEHLPSTCVALSPIPSTMGERTGARHISCIVLHFLQIRLGNKLMNYPKWGPPFIKSNTWAGFSNCLKRRRNFTPWLSPLLELTKTNRGLTQNENVALQKPVREQSRRSMDSSLF